MSKLTVPGKIFLMGEYGVIEGGKAILLALKPGFEFAVNEGKKDEYHPASPVAQHFKLAGKTADVFLESRGLGPGFGGSTAELIAGAFGVAGAIPETETLWSEYKKINPNASGADLAVQLEALRTGQCSFYVTDHGKAAPFQKSTLLNQIFMFSVNVEKKLPTHEALKQKRSISVKPLDDRVLELREVLKAENELGLEVLTSFASDLSRLFLETAYAHEIRHAFQNVAGVLGVKGCGAGLNDVFLVAIRRRNIPQALEACKEIAQAHALHFIGTLGDHAW